MNDEELNAFADILAEYLKQQKVFIQNPQRMKDVNAATEIACRLFPEAKIELEDDPLQMGAIILAIEDYDLAVRETRQFIKLIAKANNFEVLYTVEDKIRLAILFADALIKI